MNKAFKFRLYPNATQQRLINKTFGCCRYVYNLALECVNEAYHKDKTNFSYAQLSKELTELKSIPTHDFLKEVDAIALQQSLRHLDTAFKNFFSNSKKFKFPRFKSKKVRQSFTTTKSGTVLDVTDIHVRLPKIGLVKIVKHRDIPKNYHITSACVSREKDGSYYVSIQCEYNSNIIPYRPIRKATGLDYVSDGFYCDSQGNVIGSPKFYRRFEDKISFYERKLSKQKKGSANWTKTKSRIAKLNRKIANLRKDFIEKESIKLVEQYDLIGVETLDLKAMSNKGFRNGKSTLDNGYGMFLTRLQQKAKERGRFVVKVDKWFASSQICSDCGYQHSKVKDLSLREWFCPKCGRLHFRDENSAINIRGEAMIMYNTHLEQIGLWL